MKNRVLSGSVFFIIGILLAIGPYTIFPICKDAAMPMRCQTTAKAEVILGILTITIGVLLLIIKHIKLRILLNTLTIPVGILSFLFPNVITGVCSKMHMTCRSLSLPALSIISIALIAFAAINTFYLWKFIDKGENVNGQGTDFK